MRFTLPTAAATRDCGERLAGLLTAGDLVILTGGLGAGKTTLTQGIGRGLDVRGDVASPTFIIARTHRPHGTGPALIHVDAYRLGGLGELDDLDLDASVDDSVTVVEWGDGLAEALAESWLHVVLDRPRGASAADVDAEAGERHVTVTAHGPRWEGVDLGSIAVR